jgi:subtilisin family serine protease
VDEQEYIVLELRSEGRIARAGGIAGPSGGEALTAVMDVATLTPAEAAQARRAPGAHVAPLLPMKLVEPVAIADPAPPLGVAQAWGVEAVGALDSPCSGAGVRVAVLDTGIDAAHEAFRGLHVTERDFTGEGDGDRNGHGTHCAATVAGRDVGGCRVGVAPGIEELLVGKVVGSDGGSTDRLVDALLWARRSGAHVVSVSLGLDFPGLVSRWTDDGLPVQPATSRALEGYRDSLRLFDALAEVLRGHGPRGPAPVLISATGNESRRDGDPAYTVGVAPPAASDGFVAVAALGRTAGGGLRLADFSNAGARIAAPGCEILSARRGGGLTAMSGTSMAAPHAAGVAALWAERLMEQAGHVDTAVLLARLVGTSLELSDVATIDAGAGLVQAPPRPGRRADGAEPEPARRAGAAERRRRGP